MFEIMKTRMENIHKITEPNKRSHRLSSFYQGKKDGESGRLFTLWEKRKLEGYAILPERFLDSKRKRIRGGNTSEGLLHQEKGPKKTVAARLRGSTADIYLTAFGAPRKGELSWGQ